MIAAEGEQKASKALKEAADVLQQSPSALQVDHEYDDNIMTIIMMMITKMMMITIQKKKKDNHQCRSAHKQT